MSRWRDERAVTVQIGAVLLLAIVFAALALYQVNAVPAENQAIESEHNRQVHGELQDLRNGIQNTGVDGHSRFGSVTLGTRYPTRTFLTNPPDPRGTLETVDPEADVEIVDSEGTPVAPPQETKFVSYTPGYNEYDDAPTTVVEHSLSYNQFDGANVTIGDQRLLGSDRISLVLIDGDLSRTNSGTVSVRTESLDGPVTTTLESGSEITLPTQRPTVWVSELEDEDDVTVRATDTAVVIELETAYDLEIARVGVGDGAESTGELDALAAEPRGPVRGGFPGPAVDAVGIDDETPNRGQDVELEAAFRNRGETDDERGGVPIVRAEWYLRGPSASDPGEGRAEPIALDGDGTELERTGTATIPTDDLEVGEEYAVVVRAQDSRGVWSNESDVRVTAPTVTVRDGDGSSDPTRPGQSLQSIDGTVDTGDGSELAFDVENRGDAQVDIDRFAIDATALVGSQTAFDDGNRPEFEITGITQTGAADFRGRGNTPQADGTAYNVNTDPNQGRVAVIGRGERGTVRFAGFDATLGALERTTDPDEADVTVTLRRTDGVDAEFFFVRP